jgi:hypothetical protein
MFDPTIMWFAGIMLIIPVIAFIRNFRGKSNFERRPSHLGRASKRLSGAIPGPSSASSPSSAASPFATSNEAISISRA